MKQILFFIFLICMGSNAFGQIEFKPKFKVIKPQTTTVKPKEKKDIPPPTNLSKLNLPKIVAPNVFKETNIFGTKPQPNNAFEIGTPENHFSMTPKNKFQHKLGDVYQEKMTKDLDKTMVKEGLKEDDRYLVKIDLNFGQIRTKSRYFVIKFRDFGQIDGDLAKAIFNDYVIHERLEMKFEFQEFKIYFVEGINTLFIEALNRGSLGGNTGEFQIYDAEGQHILSDYWENLDAGVKAKFVIIKD